MDPWAWCWDRSPSPPAPAWSHLGQPILSSHPVPHGSPSVSLPSEWPLTPRAGPAQPLLLTPGRSLPCCWLPSCLHLEQHMATHSWASWGGSEWHKSNCDPLVNVAASRATGGPGCGSCATGGQQPLGGSSTWGCWWPVLALLCPQRWCQHPPRGAGSPQHPQPLAGGGLCQTRRPGWPVPAEPMNKISP